jgi:hypothetical protein
MNNFYRPSTVSIVIVVSFLIGIWLENGSSNFYKTYISPIINFKLPLILFLIIFAASYQYYRSRKEETDRLIENYETQVKDGSRALWKYFKDIGEMKIKEIVCDVMKEFIIKHEHVLAVQIYDYSIKHLKENTLFTVNHKYSYVSKDTDINALLQTYYRIPKDLYDDYIHAQIILEQTVLMQDGIDYVSSWCEKHLTHLENKEIKNLNEEDAITYALVEVLLDILSYKLNTNFSHSLDEEKLVKLNRLKRTGILKGIEMNQFYTFEYHGNSEKNGRKYMTKVINEQELLNGLPHIILITLNPDYLSQDEVKHNEELWKLGEELFQELQKELRVRYNNLKEVLG